MQTPDYKRGETLIGPKPVMLREFNPKANVMFKNRICRTCRRSIMTHWLLPFADREKRASWWCRRDGLQLSEGMV